MSKKIKPEDIAISRVISMLVAMLVLSGLSYLYVLPFRLRAYQLNAYYHYIEYAVMCIAFIALVLTTVFLFINRGRSEEEKVLTPAFWSIVSICAFIAAVIIPLSHNRGLFLRYSIIMYACVFLAYLAYHYISKQYAFDTVICSVFAFMFLLAGEYYTHNVTFKDAPVISYMNFLCVFGAVILLALAVCAIISRKKNGYKLLYVGVFSVLSATGVLVRAFVIEYVSLVAICVLALAWVAFAIIEKRSNKRS